MSSSQIILLLLALVDLALGGLLSNGFIVTVILREWRTSRTLGPNEQLLLSLALSNFSLTLSLNPLCINDYIINIFTNSFARLAIGLLAAFLVFSRHWFTAWLCVFYCLKIVNSTHSFFLWCKQRISWLLPWLLLASLVICLSNVFLSLCYLFPSNTTGNVSSTSQKLLPNRNFDIPKILILTVGSGCPLLVVLLCSILVVASLCRHVCRMKGKEFHSTSLQIKPHLKAAGTVLFLLVLYLSFYVVQILAVTAILGKTEGTVLTIAVMVYPCAQAYILLLVNPKLNHTATQMLRKTKA